jgi:hypothetical protein
MKNLTLFLILTLPTVAYSQACFGPGGCQPNPQPTGPTELCLPAGCTPVVYSWNGDFAVSQSTLPNGYPVAATIGPCLNPDRSACPDIFNQAFDAMRTNALQANRAQRY